MDKLKNYEIAVNELLSFMAHNYRNDDKEAVEEIIKDTSNHHYFILFRGFKEAGGFNDSIVVHFHIKPDGKVWILANWTEVDVAQELVDRGVDKNDIVIGFHPRHLRQHTGYAVV